MKSFLHRYRLPILSGILIGTSYIPFPPWAIFFCWIPLWLFLLKAPTCKQVFWGTWLVGFILSTIGFHWIAHTTSEFANLPFPIPLAVLFLFATFTHLYIPLTSVIWFQLKKRLDPTPLLSLTLWVLVYLLIDQVWPHIFRWHFGYGWLWASLPGAQAADVIGFEGLHLITLFLNVCAFAIWQNRRDRPRLKTSIQYFLGILIAINAFGAYRKFKAEHIPLQKAKVLIVQPNVGNFEKAAAEHARDYLDIIFNSLESLTRKGVAAHPDADFVVWPETSYPEELDVPGRPLNLRFEQMLKTLPIPVVTGSYSRSYVPRVKHTKIHNGFFVFNTDSVDEYARYQKTFLLAFGEYFPGSDLFEPIKSWFPFVSDFGRGDGPKVLPLKNWHVGPQICYEGLFPTFSSELVHQGADFFINLTNDSWFGYPFEPFQHLTMTAARAVEFRMPLVRATNTGLTTVVDIYGHFPLDAPRATEWVGAFDFQFPVEKQFTIYSYLAPWWTSFLVFLFLAFVGFIYGKNKTARS